MIISGGQTGVDRAALDAALEWGIPCGGYCPKGRRAEDGKIPSVYPLRELPSPHYPERTLKNILQSDGTLVIYFSSLEGGTAMTVELCHKNDKPILLLDGDAWKLQQSVLALIEFCQNYQLKILNVAGPRHSKSPQAHEYTFNMLRQFFAWLA